MAVLNEEQEMLRDMAREWTTNESPVSNWRKVRASGDPQAWDASAYATMAEMGWTDVGNWAALHALLPRDESGNSVERPNRIVDCEDTLVRSDGPRITVVGVENLVIVADGDGHYRPVAVTPGREVDGETEIVDGLVEGDRVVVSGQFLIDSEASLSGAFHRMGDDGVIR